VNKLTCLAVVWGLRTQDRAFLHDFYPWRRLTDEATKRSLELRFLFPQEAVDPDGQHSDVLRDCQAILLRGKTPPNILDALHNSGIPCINTPKSITLAGDKLACARWLTGRGWPTPTTWIPSTNGEALHTQATPFPCVVKPRYGSRGGGVFLVHDKTALCTAIHRIGVQGLGQALCQDYVETSHGRELRCFVIKGHKTSLALRRAHGTNLVVNSAAGGSIHLITDPREAGLPHTVIETSEQIIHDAGLVYGTVDWLFTGPPNDAGLTVCELNASPGFEALEGAGAGNIAGAILDALLCNFA